MNSKSDEVKEAYDRGEKELARELLLDAYKTEPENLDILANLGKVSSELGLFGEAIAWCEKVLHHDPRNTYMMARMASVYALEGEIHTAIALLRKARAIHPLDNRNHSDLLIALHYAPLSEEEIFKEHLEFARVFETPHVGKKMPLYGHTKLRIGYITHDVAEHAIWYILRALLPHHNRNLFDIYLYWTNPLYNAAVDELPNSGDVWRTVGNENYADIRAKILADEIDVLIDLSGHTGGNVLPIFAERSAPIQMSWFGYMDTTGLSNMDYRITDRFRTSETRECFYTEKLLYLSDSYAFTPRANLPPIAHTLPMQRNGYMTFGSFNAMKKINPPLIDTWSAILLALPSARLIILAEKSIEWGGKLRRQFSLNGVRQDQISFERFRPVDQFLALVSSVDVALDSFPYTGGITTYHALSVGVPSITLLGTTEYERNCAAIQKSVDLEDFTAQTQKEYVQKAILQNTNQERLLEIRKRIPAMLGQGNRATVVELEKRILHIAKIRR